MVKRFSNNHMHDITSCESAGVGRRINTSVYSSFVNKLFQLISFLFYLCFKYKFSLFGPSITAWTKQGFWHSHTFSRYGPWRGQRTLNRRSRSLRRETSYKSLASSETSILQSVWYKTEIIRELAPRDTFTRIIERSRLLLRWYVHKIKYNSF